MENSLFWELRTHEEASPSVIFGTMHLSHSDAMQHLDQVLPLIERYNCVFTESALGIEDHSNLHKSIYLTNIADWSQYITKPQFKKLDYALDKYFGIEINDVIHLRPMFIWALACQNLLDAHGESLDQFIWTYAAKKGKRLHGLESGEEQMTVLKSMSIEFEYQQLKALAFNISKTRKMLLKLLGDYREQNVQGLFRKTKKSLGPNKALLLTERNRRFADRIFDQHNIESSFFCFGAGHLAGKFGVLKLLKQKGASIKPLKNN